MHANGKWGGAEEKEKYIFTCVSLVLYVQYIELLRVQSSTNVCTIRIYSSIIHQFKTVAGCDFEDKYLNYSNPGVLQAFSCWMYAIWGGRQLIRNKLPCKYKDRNYSGWRCEGRLCRWMFVQCFLVLLLLWSGCVLYVNCVLPHSLFYDKTIHFFKW